MIYRFGLMALATALLSAPLAANAAFISSTLGNPDSGLVDGQIVSSTDILGLQQNQSPPFDNIYGDDALDAQNGNFFQVWVHTYATIAEPILSATLTLGIWDHDSAAAGSQVNLFALNNFLLTDTIDAVFEAGGGEDFQYNVYEIAITGDALQSLAPGAAGFNLSLSGPTIDADGNQTYTFSLRDDIPWVKYDPVTGETTQEVDEEGNPRFVNAHDVVYGVQRTLDPATASDYGYVLYGIIKNAFEVNTGEEGYTLEDVGVVALDDYTVQFTLMPGNQPG